MEKNRPLKRAQYALGWSLVGVGVARALEHYSVQTPVITLRAMTWQPYAVLSLIVFLGPVLLPLMWSFARKKPTAVAGIVLTLSFFALAIAKRFQDLAGSSWPWFGGPGILAATSYLCLTSSKRVLPRADSGSWDDAKLLPEQDTLGRTGLARTIAEALLARNLPVPARIGLYGPWGSGKSTVLNFVAHYLKGQLPMVSFNPWQYRTQQAAWTGFVEAVEKTVLENSRGQAATGLTIAKWMRAVFPLSRLWKPETEIGKALYDVVVSSVQDMLADKKRSLFHALEEFAHEHGRLVVLIDDMDRLDPKLAVEILSALKELLDHPSITYILALDFDALTSSIRQAYPSLKHDGAKQYLEKIVQWPIEIGRMSAVDLLKDRELSPALASIDSGALDQIIDFLPNNPRQVKRFIWTLATQHPVSLLSSNSPGIDWRIVYVLKLLQVQFPAAFSRLVEKDELRKSLGIQGKLMLAGKDTERKKTLDEWRTLLVQGLNLTSQDEDAAWSILTYLQTVAGPQGADTELDLLLHVTQADWLDNLLTKLLSTRTHSDRSQRLKMIRSFLERVGTTETKTWQDCFRYIVQKRQLVHSMMVDTSPTEMVLELRQSVTALGDLLHDLIRLASTVSEPTEYFTPAEFTSLWQMCARQAPFTFPYYYLAVRAQERELLLCGADLATSDPKKYLEAVPSEPDTLEGPFSETWNKLVQIRAEQLLLAFERSRGIHEAITNDTKMVDRSILFEQNEHFHSHDCRMKLFELLSKAKESPVIRDNLYDYFSRLASDYRRSALVDDRPFITLLWKFLGDGDLNYRHIGSLLDIRRSIQGRWNLDDALPLPDDPIWRHNLNSKQR